jgi:hypothetical protein
MQGNVRGGRCRHGRMTPSPETRPAASILPRPGVSRDVHQHTGQRRQPEGLVPERLAPCSTREHMRRNHAVPRQTTARRRGGP